MVGDGSRASEAERIAGEYRRRDARAEPRRAADPAWLLHFQDLEWHLLDLLSAVEAPLTGARVLDVGAGSGYLLHRLVELGAGAGVGFDLMEERVAAARRRYPALDWVQGDATRLPFEAGSFDLVTQFTCLSSVLDPAVRAEIAAEMWRVLRPGGTVVSYDLRPAPAPIRLAGRVARRRLQRSGAVWTPVEPLDGAELRRLFPAAAGRLRTVSLNAALPVALRRRRGVALLLARVPALRSHGLLVARKVA